MKNNIKLKRIELEAFRGYNEKVVFDFELPNNKVADIVAIYAPNGFGKTSFFDGIEWNSKGTIERFEENSKIKNAAKEFGGSILKNRESELDNGSVNLIDEENLHFKRITSNSDNWDLLKGRIDTKSTSPLKHIEKLKNYKRIEILPQSRIDSFLSSKTPEEKYQALLDFWDGADDSAYFVGVSKFLEENFKGISELYGEISDLNSEVAKLSTSESKIELFNRLIDTINSFDKEWDKLENFTLETSETDFDKTIRDINNKIAMISSRIAESYEKNIRLTGLKEGNKLYGDNTKLIEKINPEINALQDIILNFSELEANDKNTIELDIEFKKKAKELSDANDINKLRDKFKKIDNDINILITEKDTLSKAQITKIQSKNTADKKEREDQATLEQINKNESKLTNNDQQLSVIFTAIKDNEAKVNNADHRLKICKIIKDKRDASIKSFRTNLTIIQEILSASLISFCSSDYDLPDFNEEITLIKSKSDLLDTSRKDLDGLRKEYNKAGSLDENLHKVIELGKSFIIETETKTCPLCSTKQKDYSTLLSLISMQKNDVLNLGESQDKIKALELEIGKAEYSLSQLFEKLKEQLRPKSTNLAKSIKSLNEKTQKIEALISYYSNGNIISSDENRKLIEQQKDIELENVILKSTLEKSKNLKEKLSKSIDDSKKEIRELNEQIAAEKGRLVEIEALLENKKNNIDYTSVREFLVNLSIEEKQYIEKGLDQIINELSTKDYDIKSKMTVVSQRNLVLRKQLKDQNKNDLFKRIDEQKNILNLTHDKITTYHSQYKLLTGKEAVLLEVINTEIVTLEAQQIKLQEIDIKLRELQENIELIQQNIRLNVLRKDIIKKDKELKDLEEESNKLTTLKSELSIFLKEKIDSVFNQDIINDIYKKIDPHPEFTEIYLETQFDGIKPKLFIKAINIDKTREIDPILYLSSGQVNILSLSIFLAKALQNKDTMINTIFMDDPIQYLDSINVLSFIDLLRSIVMDKKLDRQLVISTHDENFFNLLKKKFDPNYCNSKFIEFESYGKLKMN